jgi:medium-chain acyl-[acyl-carrier-protein] hydrolase
VPLTSVAEIAADVATRYAEAFTQPYALYGHSFGSYVAYEVACLLSGDLGIPPSRLIVAACPPPPAERAEDTIHLESDAAVEEYVRSHAATPEEVFASRELRALMMRSVRADLEAVETYTVSRGAAVNVPITAISGSADPDVTPAEMLGWRAFTHGSFDRRIVDGDHFFVQRSADALIDVLRDVLVSAGRRPTPCRPAGAAART